MCLGYRIHIPLFCYLLLSCSISLSCVAFRNFFSFFYQDIITSQEENEILRNEFDKFRSETNQEIIKLKVKLIYIIDLFLKKKLNVTMQTMILLDAKVDFHVM